MLQIKAVVWDIGGVLLTDPQYKDFWKNIDGSKKLRELFGSGKISVLEFVKQASPLLGLSEEKFLEKYKEAYCVINKNEGACNVYSLMKIPKYILSDTNPIHLEHLHKSFPEIFESSKGTFASPEIGIRKSNPLAYKFIIEKIGFSPNEILLIDNKQEVLDLAAKEGIRTLLFENCKKLKKDLSDFGVDF